MKDSLDLTDFNVYRSRRHNGHSGSTLGILSLRAACRCQLRDTSQYCSPLKRRRLLPFGHLRMKRYSESKHASGSLGLPPSKALFTHMIISHINSLGFFYLFSVSLWRRANARNVRLYYPYWQYTDLFIFRFVSLLCLRSTLRYIYIYVLTKGILTKVNLMVG